MLPSSVVSVGFNTRPKTPPVVGCSSKSLSFPEVLLFKSITGAANKALKENRKENISSFLNRNYFLKEH